MKSKNKLLKTILSIFKTLEELLSHIISLVLTLVVLAGIGAILFMLYKVASYLIASTNAI